MGGRLASGPTPAILLSKRLLNRAVDADRTTAFAEEAAAQEIAMTSEDAAEGVRSFVERRPPRFRAGEDLTEPQVSFGPTGGGAMDLAGIPTSATGTPT